MKKLFSTLALLCVSLLLSAQVIAPGDSLPVRPGGWYCFRNTLKLNKRSKDIQLRIAADSKYWLWINGRLQVREGGLKRGPNPHDTYCDLIDRLPLPEQVPGWGWVLPPLA